MRNPLSKTITSIKPSGIRKFFETFKGLIELLFCEMIAQGF